MFFFLPLNLKDENTSIMIDHELQHNTSLHNAHRGIDDLLGQGAATISNLRDQRSMLKVSTILFIYFIF